MTTLEKLNDVHTKALNYMGGVRPNVRSIAIEILAEAQAAGHTIKIVYGLNPASKPEHSAGTALDFMVYGDKAAGDFVANYAWTHRSRLGLRWEIWRQRIRSATPGKPDTWQRMADRGSGTQNHMDHPHLNFRVKDYVAPSGSSPKPPAQAKPKKDLGTLASEVIKGQWGNGADRVRRLKALGYDAAAVQAEVNKRLKGKTPAKPSQAKYRVVTNSVPINGRSGPGANYRVTMTAAKGCVLTIVEIKSGWARSTGGHWYNTRYLKKL